MLGRGGFLLLILLIACESVPPAESQQDGAKAFPFQLDNLEKQTVSLKDFSGKLILLNFWATWCPPCVQEMPGLERLHQTLKSRGFEVVAISIDDPESRYKVENFVKKSGLSFSILLDPAANTLSRFGVMGVPESFFIGPNGRVLAFDDPKTGKKIKRIISERAWDSPAYIKAVTSLLEKHLGGKAT